MLSTYTHTYIGTSSAVKHLNNKIVFLVHKFSNLHTITSQKEYLSEDIISGRFPRNIHQYLCITARPKMCLDETSSLSMSIAQLADR